MRIPCERTVPFSRLNATPAGVRLGPVELIADRKARNFVLQVGERRFHGLVVRWAQPSMATSIDARTPGCRSPKSSTTIWPSTPR